MLLKQKINKLSSHRINSNKEKHMSIGHQLKSLTKYWFAAMSTSNMAMSLVAQETQAVTLVKLLNLNSQKSTNTQCCVCC